MHVRWQSAHARELDEGRQANLGFVQIQRQVHRLFCILDVLNSDEEEAAGVYSCQVSNAENSAVCDAYVICKTSKKDISILTTHSLTHSLL